MMNEFVRKLSDCVHEKLGHDVKKEKTFDIRVVWSLIDYDSGYENAEKMQNDAFVEQVYSEVEKIIAKHPGLRFVGLNDMSTVIDPTTFNPVISFKAVFA